MSYVKNFCVKNMMEEMCSCMLMQGILVNNSDKFSSPLRYSS